MFVRCVQEGEAANWRGSSTKDPLNSNTAPCLITRALEVPAAWTHGNHSQGSCDLLSGFCPHSREHGGIQSDLMLTDRFYGGLFVFLFLIFLIVIFLFIYFYFCLVISFIILILLLLAFIHISISFSTLNFLSFYYLVIFVFCSFIDLLLLLDLLNVYAFLCQFIGWHFHKYTCVYINKVWIIVCIHFTNIWLTILLSNLPFRFTGKSNVHL